MAKWQYMIPHYIIKNIHTNCRTFVTVDHIRETNCKYEHKLSTNLCTGVLSG